MKTQFKNLSLYLALIILPFSLQSQSWIPQANGLLPINYGIIGISVVSDSVVWAVAFDQTVFPIPPDHLTKVLKTNDGGETWEIYDIEEASGRISFDIVAFDQNTAFITTQDYGNGIGRGVFKTEDGGETWEEKFHHVAGGVWIRFFNEMEGVIINRQAIATTEDGGETWQLVDAVNIPTFQSNEATILASGNNSCQMLEDHIWFGTDKGRVYRSNNKGKTWEVFDTDLGPDALVLSVTFKDTLTGIALDASLINSRLSKTSDGGETWEFFTSNPDLSLDNIAYVPGTDSILMGSTSFYVSTENRVTAYSEDFGKNWNIISVETIDDSTSFGPIQFIEPNIGWTSRDFVTLTDQEAMFKWDSDIFVGAESISRIDQYNIFPNPFSESISIEGKNHSPQINSFFIFDNTGKLIKTGILNANNAQLELGTLNPGIYYLELNTDGVKIVRKIIKAN